MDKALILVSLILFILFAVFAACYFILRTKLSDLRRHKDALELKNSELDSELKKLKEHHVPKQTPFSFSNSTRLYLYRRSKETIDGSINWLAYFETQHFAGDCYESALNRIISKHSDNLKTAMDKGEPLLLLISKFCESENCFIFSLDASGSFDLFPAFAAKYGSLYEDYHRLPFDKISVSINESTCSYALSLSDNIKSENENNPSQSIYGRTSFEVTTGKPVLLIDRDIDKRRCRNSPSGNDEISFICYAIIDNRTINQSI